MKSLVNGNSFSNGASYANGAAYSNGANSGARRSKVPAAQKHVGA